MSTLRLWWNVPPTLAFPAPDAWGAALVEGPATADAASSTAPTRSIATESMSRLCMRLLSAFRADTGGCADSGRHTRPDRSDDRDQNWLAGDYETASARLSGPIHADRTHP